MEWVELPKTHSDPQWWVDDCCSVNCFWILAGSVLQKVPKWQPWKPSSSHRDFLALEEQLRASYRTLCVIVYSVLLIHSGSSAETMTSRLGFTRKSLLIQMCLNNLFFLSLYLKITLISSVAADNGSWELCHNHLLISNWTKSTTMSNRAEHLQLLSRGNNDLCFVGFERAHQICTTSCLLVRHFSQVVSNLLLPSLIVLFIIWHGYCWSTVNRKIFFDVPFSDLP